MSHTNIGLPNVALEGPILRSIPPIDQSPSWPSPVKCTAPMLDRDGEEEEPKGLTWRPLVRVVPSRRILGNASSLELAGLGPNTPREMPVQARRVAGRHADTSFACSRRGAVALLLIHAHTPKLEASAPSPKCACLAGTDPSAGLRHGRQSRESMGLIATRRQEEPNATRTLDPGITFFACPARRDA